mmetsp:Transcript_4359/g.14146  ORF Transcript_4359/g.14146 Transcript_4359/m.14146 type:complete len:293 (-) Transcript_4359:1449-2327(-)
MATNVAALAARASDRFGTTMLGPPSVSTTPLPSHGVYLLVYTAMVRKPREVCSGQHGRPDSDSDSDKDEEEGEAPPDNVSEGEVDAEHPYSASDLGSESGIGALDGGAGWELTDRAATAVRASPRPPRARRRSRWRQRRRRFRLASPSLQPPCASSEVSTRLDWSAGPVPASPCLCLRRRSRLALLALHAPPPSLSSSSASSSSPPSPPLRFGAASSPCRRFRRLPVGSPIKLSTSRMGCCFAVPFVWADCGGCCRLLSNEPSTAFRCASTREETAGPATCRTFPPSASPTR